VHDLAGQALVAQFRRDGGVEGDGVAALLGEAGRPPTQGL
jgi:hypothetical protein